MTDNKDKASNIFKLLQFPTPNLIHIKWVDGQRLGEWNK